MQQLHLTVPGRRFPNHLSSDYSCKFEISDCFNCQLSSSPLNMVLFLSAHVVILEPVPSYRSYSLLRVVPLPGAFCNWLSGPLWPLRVLTVFRGFYKMSVSVFAFSVLSQTRLSSSRGDSFIALQLVFVFIVNFNAKAYLNTPHNSWDKAFCFFHLQPQLPIATRRSCKYLISHTQSLFLNLLLWTSF